LEKYIDEYPISITGEGAEGQKYEIEPLGLDFGHAIGNGGEEQWQEVGQWWWGIAFTKARREKG
jgi:hypothetical protein